MEAELGYAAGLSDVLSWGEGCRWLWDYLPGFSGGLVGRIVPRVTVGIAVI